MHLQRQAARESAGWENVTGNLNGAWRQLLATLGQPVLMIAIDGVQRMTTAVEMLTKWANAAVNALSGLFGIGAEQSAAISGNIADSVDNQNALTEAVAETEKAQKGSLAAFDELNILTSKDDDNAEDSGNSGTAAIIPIVSENAVEKAADDLRKRFENLLEPIKIAWEDESPTIFENAKRAVNAIKLLILSIGESVEEVFTNGSGEQLAKNILKIFGNLLGIIGDIATALEIAWNSGAIFDGIVDGIFNVFRDVVNSLIYGINCVIWEPFNAINAALGGIRGVEIMGFTPFDWLPYINIPQIPYLAQGTVVPANYGNFLAVLGDNKREAEVVSPISSIEKAVENVLARHGMPKEITVVTYLYPNSAAYHREIIKIVNDDNRRKGL